MTEEERRIAIEQAELALGHYRHLTLAVAEAVTRCCAWRTTDEKKVFTPQALYDLACKTDEKGPLEEPAFYMVSSEGAIGKSPGLEFLTLWKYIPLEAGEKRDAIISQLVKEAEKSDSLPPLPPSTQPSAPASHITPPSAPKKKFCTNCGAPLSPGYKFCTQCGASV